MREIQRVNLNSNKATIQRKYKAKRKMINRLRLCIAILIIFTASINVFGNAKEIVIGERKIPGTEISVINKIYRLEENYVPKDLVKVDIDFLAETTEEERYMTEEAGKALKELVLGAAKDGVILMGLSGYRSYETQRTLYNYNLEINGQAYVDRYVAPPGSSEHQLGEGMDLATQWGWITEGCPEAKWIASNAHKYGFIVRYESGKENITGYNYEPWHVRYVGNKAAKEIYEGQFTLEEYAEKQ